MKAKRRAITALSAACLLLLACTAALALYTPRGAQDAQAGGTVYEITNIPVGEIRAVAVSNAEAIYGLMQSGGEITMVSDVQGVYSAAELRALVYAACHLTGKREIRDLSAAEQYGINSPLARITLIRSDGGEVNLSLLSQNPIDGSYFLFSEEKQAIYLIPPGEAELFLRREKDFESHTIFPPVSAENYRTVQEISLDFRRKGRDYKIENRPEGFYIVEPIYQRVPPVAVMEKLRYISMLYADSVVAAGAELSQYGFDEYTLRLSMTCGGTEYTALLLDREDGTMLMANPENGAVYELGSEYLPELLQDYLALTGSTAFSYAAGDIRSVSVADGAREVLFELSGEGESLTAAVNGKKLDNAALAGLMGVFNSCGIEKEVFGAPAGAADLTITFTMRSGRTETVAFVPAAEGSCYVSVNGVVNFTTTRAAAEAVREAAFAYRD